MEKKVFIFILILTQTFVYKQIFAHSWEWAKSAVGTSNDMIHSISTDASGNVYVTGTFHSDSITFGTTTLTNRGVFLVKYNESGNVIWAKSAGGGDLYDRGNSVSTDASGNVYVTGTFHSDSITFGTTTLKKSVVARFNSDIFLVKYDGAGNVLWAKSAGGNSVKYGQSVSTDPSGNVYISGTFHGGSIIFGSTTLSYPRVDNIFLAKYDGSGNVLWAKGGFGEEHYAAVVASISTDAWGNAYITGRANGSITFGATTLTNKGFFLVKYDASGNVLWVKSAVGFNHNIGESVSTDALGNVYVTGSFGPNVSFGKDTLTVAGSLGAPDIFIAKYNASGILQWVKSAGGIDYEHLTSVSTDASGNVYIAGTFTSPDISFGEYNLTNKSNFDTYIAKYDTLGNVLWAISVGGSDYDYGAKVSTNVLGNVFIGGSFNNKSITFGADTLNNEGGYDIFIAKYCSCCKSTSSHHVTSCNSYVWNSKTYTTSGVYMDTIPNAAGCDSIMTLNLTINTLPAVNLVLSPDTVCISTGAFPLSGGSPAGGTYSGPGVNSGNFDPSTAGVGLHTITYSFNDVNSCTDSMVAQIFVDKCPIIIYPNPFSAQVVLHSDQLIQNATLTVENYLGQTIIQIKDITGHKFVLSRGNLASGLYLFHLTQNNIEIFTQKIVITD